MQRFVQSVYKSWYLPLLAIALGLVTLSVSAADRTIYPGPEQAKADVAAGLKAAAASHKNVILDFGGNWCGRLPGP